MGHFRLVVVLNLLLLQYVVTLTNCNDPNMWMSLGSQNLVPKATVYGAIITSVSPSQNQSHEILNRVANARAMYKQLPFPVAEWPPVYTQSCPYVFPTKNTERGLSLAHYFIWLDFIYFRHHAIHHNQSSPQPFSFVNGTFFKYGFPFLDNDIIVIFEDDADIAVKDISNVMKEELSTMTTDILYLGWCNGRLAR